MKILAIADRPPKQKISQTLLEHPDIEIICLLGDLDYFSIIELQNVPLPKLGVYGNHCSGTYFEPLGIRNMHLQTFTYKGIIFGGFEGCVKYKEDPYSKMYTQEEASVLLKDFPYVDIMLTHCPPYGINDEPEEIAHQGFKALSNYIGTYQPKYLLHGHTYPKPDSLVTRHKETKIIYVTSDVVINLN